MKWYRSLYWRIALGVVAFLAAMLAVQAVVFVWMMAQSGRNLPGQSPIRFAQMIARDLSGELDRDPEIDLERYLGDQYSHYSHPFFVMLTDGRIVRIAGSNPTEALRQATRRLLDRRATPAEEPEGANVAKAPGTPAAEADRIDPDEYTLIGNRPAPVVVDGEVVGLVVVAQRPPFTSLLAHFAPILSLAAAAVLIVGGVLTSVLIFGPPRRRLRHLEAAARRFGSGDLSARAPEGGGDEIAAVAAAFNTMATDLAARAAALEASDRTRRQLLADVSHELNTPITAMRGYLETLRMPALQIDEDTRNRYLSIVEDETSRLGRLVGDLLDLARLEGSGRALAFEQVPVAHLFARVAARHERACQSAHVTLKVSNAPGAETVWADRDRLEQALQNLAANAIRYAPAGSTLSLRAERAEDGIRISVEDAGPGIPQEHLPHIFDRFYKADRSRQGTAAGSGLGLSIVKAIVEQHGARISVTSRPGRTVFEIAGLQPQSALPHFGASLSRGRTYSKAASSS